MTEMMGQFNWPIETSPVAEPIEKIRYESHELNYEIREIVSKVFCRRHQFLSADSVRGRPDGATVMSGSTSHLLCPVL